MTAATPFFFESLEETASRSAGKSPQGDGLNAECPGNRAYWAELKPSHPVPKQAVEPEQRFTSAELEQAVEAARRETVRQVECDLRSEMASSLEQRRCEILAAIRDQLTSQQAVFDKELIHLSHLAQRLAIELAKAVIPRAVEREPLADITDGLRALLTELVTEPSIELRLQPDLVSVGTELLAELAAESGFKGAMVATEDPALDKGDAVVCWQGGVAERRLDSLQNDVIELVERWLQAQDQAIGGEQVYPRPSTAAPSKVSTENLESTGSG